LTSQTFGGSECFSAFGFPQRYLGIGALLRWGQYWKGLQKCHDIVVEQDSSSANLTRRQSS
jgi:hypothetical protein